MTILLAFLFGSNDCSYHSIATYKKFKEFGIRILVSTNVFGRGVDFERVNVVINYDMAEDIDTYLHRVGRAGRFGTKGLAISFISTDEDLQVLNGVQKKFAVTIPPLPDEIDSATYSKFLRFWYSVSLTHNDVSQCSERIIRIDNICFWLLNTLLSLRRCSKWVSQ